MKPLAKALLVLAVLFAAMFAIEACDNVEETVSDSVFLDSFETREGFSGAQPDSWLLAQEPSGSLPDGFEDELFPLDDFYEVQTNDTGSVVGLLSHSPVEDVFSACSQALQGKGWAVIEGGQPNTATFIKEGGVFAWTFVSCTEIAGDTSVVVQLL